MLFIQPTPFDEVQLGAARGREAAPSTFRKCFPHPNLGLLDPEVHTKIGVARGREAAPSQ